MKKILIILLLIKSIFAEHICPGQYLVEMYRSYDQDFTTWTVRSPLIYPTDCSSTNPKIDIWSNIRVTPPNYTYHYYYRSFRKINTGLVCPLGLVKNEDEGLCLPCGNGYTAYNEVCVSNDKIPITSGYYQAIIPKYAPNNGFWYATLNTGTVANKGLILKPNDIIMNGRNMILSNSMPVTSMGTVYGTLKRDFLSTGITFDTYTPTTIQMRTTLQEMEFFLTGQPQFDNYIVEYSPNAMKILGLIPLDNEKCNDGNNSTINDKYIGGICIGEIDTTDTIELDSRLKQNTILNIDKYPLQLSDRLFDTGGNKSPKDAYEDGVGVFTDYYNYSLNSLVLKYGAAYEESNANGTLSDFIMLNKNSSNIDKIDAKVLINIKDHFNKVK